MGTSEETGTPLSAGHRLGCLEKRDSEYVYNFCSFLCLFGWLIFFLLEEGKENEREGKEEGRRGREGKRKGKERGGSGKREMGGSRRKGGGVEREREGRREVDR